MFDFCIGNPPFDSGSSKQNSKKETLYQYFYDAAEIISTSYMLITPGRFLFKAGLTSKKWTQKMLSDEHIKVEFYAKNCSDVFDNVDIKGGVAILYRNSKKIIGPIGTFIPDETVKNIATKVKNKMVNSLSEIMHGGRSDLKFNDNLLKKYPSVKIDRIKAIKRKNSEINSLAKNDEYELKSSAFDVLPYIFTSDPKNKEDYYKILGLKDKKRCYQYIKKEYMEARDKNKNNINGFKIFIPKAIGSGKFGETIPSPVISFPGESSTPTFISIGNFTNELEAKNALKYIKTKFSRALLSVLKITQDNAPSKWEYVPLQNFTDHSDIDWSKSIPEIDQQLYKKYGLNDEEIDFIETHVKEMK